MPRFVRTAFSYVLAALLLLGAVVMAPEPVLCVGPGNHYHLETVLGASCNGSLSASDSSAPGPRDGCPKGSRDLRLNVDTHRSDNAADAATFTPVLTVATCAAKLFKLSHEAQHVARSPRRCDEQILSVVLRC